MKSIYKMLSYQNSNEINRQKWLKQTLSQLPPGTRILDAGAGELRNKALCDHLEYVSQDFGVYEGTGDGKGMQTGSWNTSKVDIISDIIDIPCSNASFDAILCSEVLEHIPEPALALREFSRILKPGGKLILTVPFASFVHLSPYHYCSGFSRYWLEHHLKQQEFTICELESNGDWFAYYLQESARFGSMARQYQDPKWPIAYFISFAIRIYFLFSSQLKSDDFACFGWNCVATKNS